MQEPAMSDLEYERAMSRILVLMVEDPAPDTDDGRELLALVDRIEVYEREHYALAFDQEAFNEVFRR